MKKNKKFKKNTTQNIFFNLDKRVLIISIISLSILIMFFSYHLFFSPMAQCVNSLGSLTKGNNSKDEIKFICVEKVGSK